MDVGDHVCWLVAPGDDYHGSARAYLVNGQRAGDKMLIVGTPPTRWLEQNLPQSLLVDPAVERAQGRSLDAEALLGLVRREAHTAGRQGFRALRVLAQMDRLWPGGATAGELARHETELDALVASQTAMVVCSYAREGFSVSALEQVAGVHPHHAGRRTGMPDFRMFNVDTDCWSVTGVVDFDGATVFGTAVRELLVSATNLSLYCQDLRLMDAAAMQALVQAALSLPGRRVLIKGANRTVRRNWSLAGYDAPQIPVELVP
ncbi:MEDS domain-containing protein [Kitasatospora sp. NPDC006697]|uniref:MEDS domain-containing protein n=1 Tax=Kitasatospora sp. NPDC006697 TaxID=3364020 RepID=UPI0036935149